MSDWDRSTRQSEGPPSAAIVYLELGLGCLGAVLLAVAALVAGVVLAVVFAVVPSMRGSNVPDLVFAAFAMSVLGVGFTQWVWLLPLAAALFRRRRAMSLGLFVGGFAVGMLNATGFAMIVFSA